MKIASFNVNSIRAHLINVLQWVEETSPDIILLQELKCEEFQFPYWDFEMMGYNIAVLGQKSWNGVAVLSKFKIEDRIDHIPGGDNSSSRYLEVFTGGVRVASIYLPNGNPLGGEKFKYKMDWMDALHKHMEVLSKYDEPILLGGDFNVIPKDMDVYDPASFKNDAVMQPEVRKAFFEFEKTGFKSAKEILYPEKVMYSYWDYFRGLRQKNRGILLDFFLLNKQAQDKLVDFGVDEEPRDRPQSSDHTPIWIELKSI